MTMTLSKGGNLSLTKQDPGLKRALIGLGWDARSTNGAEFDLDASAFLLDGNGKIYGTGEQSFVFYNNLATPDQTVTHTGDNRTGDGDGDDVVLVADVLGHRDPSMTLRVYSHVSKSHRKARVRDATTLYEMPAPPTEGAWKPTRIQRKVKGSDAPGEGEPRGKRPRKATGGN